MTFCLSLESPRYGSSTGLSKSNWSPLHYGTWTIDSLIFGYHMGVR